MSSGIGGASGVLGNNCQDPVLDSPGFIINCFDAPVFRLINAMCMRTCLCMVISTIIAQDVVQGLPLFHSGVGFDLMHI